MSTRAQTADRTVFRNTHTHLGRHISINPGNSANRHLAYGRIILNRSVPSISFTNSDCETSLICLSGEAAVKTGGEQFRVGQYDGIYIPRDSQIEVWRMKRWISRSFQPRLPSAIRCNSSPMRKSQKTRR